MPKINTKIIKNLPEPIEGKTYQIVKVSEKESKEKGLKGFEVVLAPIVKGVVETVRDNFAQTMLWYKEEAGATSKIGSFMSVLGDDTDLWVGKNIRFVEWEAKNREVEAV